MEIQGRGEAEGKREGGAWERGRDGELAKQRGMSSVLRRG